MEFYVREGVHPELDGFTSKILKVYGMDENFERFTHAKPLSEEKGGYTAVEIALAWLLYKPFPLIPVLGLEPKKSWYLVSQRPRFH